MGKVAKYCILFLLKPYKTETLFPTLKETRNGSVCLSMTFFNKNCETICQMVQNKATDQMGATNSMTDILERCLELK